MSSQTYTLASRISLHTPLYYQALDKVTTTFGESFSSVGMDENMELDEDEEQDLKAMGKALESMSEEDLEILIENEGGALNVINSDGSHVSWDISLPQP
jgi:hypothetical protein